MSETKATANATHLEHISSEGYSLGKEENVVLQLPTTSKPEELRRFIEKLDDGSIVDIVGIPFARVRAGDPSKPGAYVDFHLVDMTVLPESPEGQETSVWGNVRKPRILPDDTIVHGDIAVIRADNGLDGEVNYLTSRMDAWIKSDVFGRAVSSTIGQSPNSTMPGEVSRHHFNVYYDPVNENVTVLNANPTNSTVLLPPDPDFGEIINLSSDEYAQTMARQRAGQVAIKELIQIK